MGKGRHVLCGLGEEFLLSQPLKDTRSPDHCETKQAPMQSKSIKMIDLCNKEVAKHQEQLDLGLSLDFANVSGPIRALLQKIKQAE